MSYTFECRVPQGAASRPASACTYRIDITCKEYPLDLKSVFGTSHSSTQRRCNALLSISISSEETNTDINVCGYGEVGLPPKKAGCYEADLSDVMVGVQGIAETIGNMLNGIPIDSPAYTGLIQQYMTYDPFEAHHLPDTLFACVRPASLEDGAEDAAGSDIDQICRLLLLATDQWVVENAGEPWVRATLCGIEMAILDLWSTSRHTSLLSFIHGPSPSYQLSSFITASLKDNIQEILDDVASCAEKSPLLKIKLGPDLNHNREILSHIDAYHTELERKQQSTGHSEAKGRFVWCIDANAAWTAETAMQMLEQVLPPYLHRIYMVEQPFTLYKAGKVGSTASATVPIVKYVGEEIQSGGQVEEEIAAWKRVSEAYHNKGIYIFGDESISTYRDIDALSTIIHGVNIKLEKAGGIRGALRAALEAKAKGLFVWIGIMVTSNVSCSAAMMLAPFASSGYGDVDGVFLLTEECQFLQGGLQWGDKGNILYPPCIGLGISPKPSP